MTPGAAAVAWLALWVGFDTLGWIALAASGGILAAVYAVDRWLMREGTME